MPKPERIPEAELKAAIARTETKEYRISVSCVPEGDKQDAVEDAAAFAARLLHVEPLLDDALAALREALPELKEAHASEDYMLCWKESPKLCPCSLATLIRRIEEIVG